MGETNLTQKTDALAQYREAEAEIAQLQGDARREAQNRLRVERNELVITFSQLALLRALHDESSAESLTWFWFNHFNVFWKKGLVAAALPDYVDATIRPQALGQFRDLLLGAVTHPAMLSYLDNTRNEAGRINENLARELLELHTLGVDGGYTQGDVREVARILTGVGLRPWRPKQLKAALAAGAHGRGEFLFDPRRHEAGPKRVLGQKIDGEGFAEVESLVTFLAHHHATARHIAGKLCLYLLGEHAPAECVARAASEFSKSDGDIAKTVAVITATARTSNTPGTFKDPYRYVISAVRLLASGRDIKNTKPVVRWLAALGQPLFGCRTPDGYSLYGKEWLSAGQLTQRFALAREMVHAMPRLVGEPLSAERVWSHESVERFVASVGASTRAALAKAGSAETRLALLLSSPEFMYW